jgi:hypothetical protein
MTTNGGQDEVAATLEHVEEVRRRTRAAVHPAAFPMLLFGAFGLASTPFCAIGEGLASAPSGWWRGPSAAW